MKSVILVLSTIVSFSAHAQSPQAMRAKTFNQFFFPSGAPSNYLDPKTETKVNGTRELRTVLPGVLYRGGGAGGRNPLKKEALKALCEAGFSMAVYGYTEGFSPATEECVDRVSGRPNKLEYVAGIATGPEFKPVFLRNVLNVIRDTNKGPIFVHCWNGYHASGELAAISLREFCDWDGQTAQDYWVRHGNGAPPISRVKRFAPGVTPEISAEDRAALCQQTR